VEGGQLHCRLAPRKQCDENRSNRVKIYDNRDCGGFRVKIIRFEGQQNPSTNPGQLFTQQFSLLSRYS